MRPRDWRSFLTGAAVGVLAAKLLPVVSQAARPVARGLVAGAVDLSYKAKTMAAQAREELDTMVAEAQFKHEQMSNSPTHIASLPAAGAPDRPLEPPM